MRGNVCLWSVFQIPYRATAAGTGARTDLTGLCCTCGRVYFPREEETWSQIQGDLSFGGRAWKCPEPSMSLLPRVPSPTLLTCIHLSSTFIFKNNPPHCFHGRAYSLPETPMEMHTLAMDRVQMGGPGGCCAGQSALNLWPIQICLFPVPQTITVRHLLDFSSLHQP